MQEKWQISTSPPPSEFIAGVEQITGRESNYAAQILWQRGIRDLATLPVFLAASLYQPTAAIAFGTEMSQAIALYIFK